METIDWGALIAAAAVLFTSIAGALTAGTKMAMYLKRRAERAEKAAKANYLLRDEVSALRAAQGDVAKRVEELATLTSLVEQLQGWLTKHQERITTLEEDNKLLRKRINGLELELAATKAENEILIQLFEVIKPQISAHVGTVPVAGAK